MESLRSDIFETGNLILVIYYISLRLGACHAEAISEGGSLRNLNPVSSSTDHGPCRRHLLSALNWLVPKMSFQFVTIRVNLGGVGGFVAVRLPYRPFRLRFPGAVLPPAQDTHVPALLPFEIQSDNLSKGLNRAVNIFSKQFI